MQPKSSSYTYDCSSINDVKIPVNAPKSFGESFPKTISTNYADPFNLNSIQEIFETAQAKKVPYLLVAVAETMCEKKRYYHVFDAQYLLAYCMGKKHSKLDAINPLNNLSIKKIYFLILSCFKLDKDQICVPVDLKNDKCSFNFLDTSTFKDDSFKLFTDITNYYIEDNMTLRRLQYAASERLKDKILMPTLSDANRLSERMTILYCASDKCIRARYKLAKIIEAGSKIFPKNAKKAQELYNSITEIPTKQLHENDIRAQISAWHRAAHLLKSG